MPFQDRIDYNLFWFVSQFQSRFFSIGKVQFHNARFNIYYFLEVTIINEDLQIGYSATTCQIYFLIYSIAYIFNWLPCLKQFQ